jgi:hypothetical protein
VGPADSLQLATALRGELDSLAAQPA